MAEVDGSRRPRPRSRTSSWRRSSSPARGIASARLDAELLLAQVLATDRVGVYCASIARSAATRSTRIAR
jgi:hypothetical protein